MEWAPESMNIVCHCLCLQESFVFVQPTLCMELFKSGGVWYYAGYVIVFKNFKRVVGQFIECFLI